VDGTAHRRAVVGRAAGAAGRHAVLPLLACAVGLIVPLRAFVAEPLRVPTASMAPTLRPGDHVVVNKLAYRLGDPRRGDLVVFRPPVSGGLMLKRIVALGGDRVGLEDGVLHINGRAIRERFVDHRLVDSVYFGPVRVPSGAVFVMGDRRSDSLDSRVFGPVPRGRILGRVDLRIWPPRVIGGV
jgi:signal peptidase I